MGLVVASELAQNKGIQNLTGMIIVLLFICCCCCCSSMCSGMGFMCESRNSLVTNVCSKKTVAFDLSVMCCGLLLFPLLPVAICAVGLRLVIASSGMCKDGLFGSSDTKK